MEINDIAIRWKWLKSQLNLIRDETLRKVMFAELRKRAFEEWGFDPETTKINSIKKIELDDWEKEFVEDIQKQQIYEIDTRKEKRIQTDKEAYSRMKDFIEKGGTYNDLPEDIKSKTIHDLYVKVLLEETGKLINFL